MSREESFRTALRCLGEERGCRSRNLSVKLNCESRQWGKRVHEAVLSLCDMKRLVWGSVSLARKVCFCQVQRGIPQKARFSGPILSLHAVQPRSLNMNRGIVIEILSGLRTPERVTPRTRFLRDGDA